MKTALLSFNNLQCLKKIKNSLENSGWDCDISLSESDTEAKLCFFDYNFHIVQDECLFDLGKSAEELIAKQLNKIATVVVINSNNQNLKRELHNLGAIAVFNSENQTDLLIQILENNFKNRKRAWYLEISIDHIKRIVKRGKEEIWLRNKEFSLLSFFMENIGVALSRDQIVRAVWDREALILTNTVDVHVHNLRKKFGLIDGEPIIKTIPCIGYQFGR